MGIDPSYCCSAENKDENDMAVERIPSKQHISGRVNVHASQPASLPSG